MSDPLDIPLPPRRVIRDYAGLSGGFWRGETRAAAWGLTLLTAGLVLVNILVQFGLNRWNAQFFNAIDHRDGAALLQATLLFLLLMLAMTTVTSTQLVARMRLQLRWREWLTQRLTARWLGEQRFYRLSISAPDLDAPEFRIAEDVRNATCVLVDLANGAFTGVLTAAVFVGVLWTVGGSTSVAGVTIPGFMVFAAIGYAALLSGSMALLGRPLIRRTEEKNRSEAQLRTEMGRVRENAESIAMIGGEADEGRGLGLAMSAVVVAWRRVINQLGRMSLLAGANGVIVPVVPLLLCAPGYLAGTMSLGAMMQTAAAFVQVQVALNWLVDNYAGIADWRAAAGRVEGLWFGLTELDASIGLSQVNGIVMGDSPDENLHLEGLTVAQHSGLVMILESHAIIARGEKVLLVGASGTGKTTLVRAVAGLWPWGAGRVLVPAGARTAFLPQRPYMPVGTLRQALQYPDNAESHDDASLRTALVRCGLRRLIPRLDEATAWDKLLSGGELQRIGFARLLVRRPDIVIMDEATSALDTEGQDLMMELFRHELSAATLISVGHRPELEEYHDRKLTLIRRSTGVAMSSSATIRTRDRLATLIPRALRPGTS